MGNLLSYLRWRGDLSFDAAPFNEIDSLVFTQLCFMDLHTVIKEGETPTLREVEERFFKTRDRASFRLGVYFPTGMGELLTRAASSVRFSFVRLVDAKAVIDPQKKIQFTAMTFLLPDKTLYIAYRGTDDTLFGWYESLSFGVYDETESHRLALDYFERTMQKRRFSRVRVGGHSKGGHLASYAVLKGDPRYHRRILAVYNVDGPGFRGDLYKSDAYRALQSRFYTVTPEMSIIGSLLNGCGNIDVVRSDGKVIFQHDVFNWHIEGASFVRLDRRSTDSVKIEKSLKAWLLKVDDSHREKFLDALYRLLTASGATTISEISEDKLNSAYQFGKTLLSFDKETRDVVSRAVMILVRESMGVQKAQKELLKQQKKNKKSDPEKTGSDDNT